MSSFFDQLLARPLPSREISVPMDGGAAATRLDQARQKLTEARVARLPDDQVQSLKDAVKAAETANREALAVLTLTGISRGDYRRLEEAHPPRDDEDASWNTETFPPALVTACLKKTYPEVEETQIIELFDRWSPGDLAVLTQTAQELSMLPQISTKKD